jgi:zinc-ribbon domain
VSTFCTNCGTTLHPDMKFCAKCGTKMPTTAPALESSGALSAAYFAEPASRQQLPAPPSLHWGILLALSVATAGIFGWVWALVLATWVKRLTGTVKPLIWCSFSILPVFLIFGRFSLRKYVLIHYNTVEPINLKIGGWKTFFGSIFYLQYRFTQIARLKVAQPHLFAPHATPISLPHQQVGGLAADMRTEVLHR